MFYIEEILNTEEIIPLFLVNDLTPVLDADYTAGLYSDRRLIGTASLKGDIIQGVILDQSFQGEGLAAKLMTHMIEFAGVKGVTTLYLFTKANKQYLFEKLGFRLIASCKYASMLEYGRRGMDTYLSTLAEEKFPDAESVETACIVMNCNPFTKGHRYLAEYAASHSRYLYVMVVEEDVSQFCFQERYKLAVENLKDLDNVKVLPGGKYIISALTFPSYFTKKKDAAKAHATMDLTVFGKYIAPVLGIRTRYIGSEPLSPVTAVYNETMKELLPQAGIQVCEVERVTDGTKPVSASAVRKAISNHDEDELRRLLPDATYRYVIEKYRMAGTRILTDTTNNVCGIRADLLEKTCPYRGEDNGNQA